LRAATALFALMILPVTALAQSAVDRGKYLATIGDCTDCHTPGYFFGQPDMTRYLGGSDIGFHVPNMGIFVGPNLTSDKETGLGSWTDEQIATALTTGVRPDGRILAPIMPWRALAHLSKPDLAALVAYLRSLPPVSHKVPGPFGSDDTSTVPVMKLTFPSGVAPPAEPPQK
jgi:mono/diheme cytochrome c family protein